MQNVEIVDPIGFEIKATELENGQWRLKLHSQFNEKDRDAAENTLAALQERYNCKARIVGDTVVYGLTAPRNVVMNTLVFEFLSWSDFSKMTIDDVISNLANVSDMIGDIKWNE